MGEGRAGLRPLDGEVPRMDRDEDPAEDAEELAILRAGVDEVGRLTRADVAMGGLVQGATVVLSAFRGTRTTVLRGLEIRAGAGLGGRAVVARRPMAAEDYLAETGITHHYDPQVAVEGIRSIVAVPIVLGGGVAGGARDGASEGVAGLLYAGIRRPVGIGGRGLHDVAAVAARVGQELTIRREVARRLAESRRVQREVPPGVGGSELEAVRAAHAELRALAGGVLDGDLRAQLEAVSARLADVVGGARAGESPAAVRLSGREVDVLAQVALGCTNAEVAARLDVGVETVKAHLRSASRKLGARTRHEAVVAARRVGALP
jgi:DNA-binding CsgD family transcriptional regulator